MAKKIPDCALIKGGENQAGEMSTPLREALATMIEPMQDLFLEGQEGIGAPFVELGVMDENLDDSTDGVDNLRLAQVCAAADRILASLEGDESEQAAVIREEIQKARRAVRKLVDRERSRQGQEKRANVERLLKRVKRPNQSVQNGDMVVGLIVAPGVVRFDDVLRLRNGRSYIEGDYEMETGDPEKIPCVAIVKLDTREDKVDGKVEETIPRKWLNLLDDKQQYSAARRRILNPDNWNEIRSQVQVMTLMPRTRVFHEEVKQGDVVVVSVGGRSITLMEGVDTMWTVSEDGEKKPFPREFESDLKGSFEAQRTDYRQFLAEVVAIEDDKVQVKLLLDAQDPSSDKVIQRKIKERKAQHQAIKVAEFEKLLGRASVDTLVEVGDILLAKVRYPIPGEGDIVGVSIDDTGGERKVFRTNTGYQDPMPLVEITNPDHPGLRKRRQDPCLIELTEMETGGRSMARGRVLAVLPQTARFDDSDYRSRREAAILAAELELLRSKVKGPTATVRIGDAIIVRYRGKQEEVARGISQWEEVWGRQQRKLNYGMDGFDFALEPKFPKEADDRRIKREPGLYLAQIVRADRARLRTSSSPRTEEAVIRVIEAASEEMCRANGYLDRDPMLDIADLLEKVNVEKVVKIGDLILVTGPDMYQRRKDSLEMSREQEIEGEWARQSLKATNPDAIQRGRIRGVAHIVRVIDESSCEILQAIPENVKELLIGKNSNFDIRRASEQLAWPNIIQGINHTLTVNHNNRILVEVDKAGNIRRFGVPGDTRTYNPGRQRMSRPGIYYAIAETLTQEDGHVRMADAWWVDPKHLQGLIGPDGNIIEDLRNLDKLRGPQDVLRQGCLVPVKILPVQRRDDECTDLVDNREGVGCNGKPERTEKTFFIEHGGIGLRPGAYHLAKVRRLENLGKGWGKEPDGDRLSVHTEIGRELTLEELEAAGYKITPELKDPNETVEIGDMIPVFVSSKGGVCQPGRAKRSATLDGREDHLLRGVNTTQQSIHRDVQTGPWAAQIRSLTLGPDGYTATVKLIEPIDITEWRKMGY